MTFRADNPDLFDNGLGVAAIRESGTGVKLTIATHFDNHWRTADVTVEAGWFVFDLNLRDPSFGVSHFFFKWLIELINHLNPISLAGFNPIKFRFDVRRKLDIHDVREEFNDQAVDDLT